MFCYKSVCVCVCVCTRMHVCELSHSAVSLFATPWTAAHQAPQSLGFSRQEHCSDLPFPAPGDLPDPGIPGKKTRLDGSHMWLSSEKSQNVASWWPGPKGNRILNQRNSGSQLLETEEHCRAPSRAQAPQRDAPPGHAKQSSAAGPPQLQALTGKIHPTLCKFLGLTGPAGWASRIAHYQLEENFPQFTKTGNISQDLRGNIKLQKNLFLC